MPPLFFKPPSMLLYDQAPAGGLGGAKEQGCRGGGDSWGGGYRTRGSREARSGRPFSLRGGVPASVGETEHLGQERE